MALDTPAALKDQIGGDVIAINSRQTESLSALIRERFGVTPLVFNGTLRIEKEKGHMFINEVVDAFPGMIDSVSFSKPTLEDVFIARTGHRFWEEQ